MAKKRRQRQWQVGAEYELRGSWGRQRRVKLIGRAKIQGRETLLLQPLRKAAKHRKKGRKKR